MEVIFSCLVIVFFIIGTVFGFWIGKNGYVRIGTAKPEEEKEKKLTAEQQLVNMMNYDGKRKRSGE